ncbi:hypothetical protein ACIBJF_47720 [Streptomyces sp. NPDC050743]|uniref:hypothetical protein n=1 Tax=Streptomyces sp. NPDC050743 TaxID=3365634 RepID=UPI0037A253EE
MVYVAVSALSHPGAIRDRNEDSLVIGPWALSATVTETPQTLVFPLGTPLIVAVAAGLGGQPGEVASEDDVRRALHACNRAVYTAAGAGGGTLATMGTTVAGAVVLPRRCWRSTWATAGSPRPGTDCSRSAWTTTRRRSQGSARPPS